MVPVAEGFTAGLGAGRDLGVVLIPANIGLAGFDWPPVISSIQKIIFI